MLDVMIVSFCGTEILAQCAMNADKLEIVCGS